MGEAPAGRVLASSTVHDLVVGSGLRFEDRGRQGAARRARRVGPVGGHGVNFARDVVDAAPPGRLAIVELARDGARREWRFGEVAEQAALLHAHLAAQGARRGDVVLTLLGNRPEWVLAMVACFRAGYAVLPCTEQLRPKDLRLRLDVTGAALVVADERNRDVLEAAGWNGPTVWAPWGAPAGA